MQREIRDVRRCSKCQTVLCALVDDTYIADDGETVRSLYWLPRRVHTGQECTRMLTLATEEWPVLFELEA